MCLIIHKPAGITVPGDLIRSAWEDNPDGAGIMYRADDGLKVYKILPSDWADPARHIESVLSEMEGVEAGIHFRWKTHGPVNRDNAHPFPIPKTGGYVMHNGIIGPNLLGPHYEQVRHVMSDTAFYVLTSLAEAPGADDPQFWELVGADVGSHNKMLYMDAAGRFLRVNDSQWSDYKGLRLSNLLSVPGWGGDNWRRYYMGSGTRQVDYDRSDAGPDSDGDSSEAVVIYTRKDGKPSKLSRRERKILNRCLREGNWGPLDDLYGRK